MTLFRISVQCLAVSSCGRRARLPSSPAHASLCSSGQVRVLQAHRPVRRLHHVPRPAVPPGARAEAAVPGAGAEGRRRQAVGECVRPRTRRTSEDSVQLDAPLRSFLSCICCEYLMKVAYVRLINMQWLYCYFKCSAHFRCKISTGLIRYRNAVNV